jgi:hypothetical protein
MKHITEMTIKEVVELYLSNVVLDEEDDIYAQEFYWNEICDAFAIKDLNERSKYLQSLDYKKDFNHYNKNERWNDE